MQPGQKHPKPSAVGGAQQCYATAVWLTAQYKDDRCKEGGQGGLGIYFESIRPHDMISGADATLWISLECDPCLMFNCSHEVNFEQIYSAVPFSVLQPGRVYNKYRYLVFYSILKIKAKLADFACLTSSMSCSLSACLMSWCSPDTFEWERNDKQWLLSQICCKCPSPAVTVKKLKCKGGRLDKRRLLCSVSPAASNPGSNRNSHQPNTTFTRFSNLSFFMQKW